jgi:hypothetical protein
MTYDEYLEIMRTLPVRGTYNVGGRSSGRIRTIYEPLYGITIVEEENMPLSMFRPSTSWVWIDIAVSKDVAEVIAKHYNGIAIECPYCEQDDMRYYVQVDTFKTAAQFAWDRKFAGLWQDVLPEVEV